MNACVYKVIDVQKKVIAQCRYAEDAALIASVTGVGTIVKYRYRWIIWREGKEETTGGQSVDRCARIMLDRIKAHIERMQK